MSTGYCNENSVLNILKLHVHIFKWKSLLSCLMLWVFLLLFVVWALWYTCLLLKDFVSLTMTLHNSRRWRWVISQKWWENWGRSTTKTAAENTAETGHCRKRSTAARAGSSARPVGMTATTSWTITVSGHCHRVHQQRAGTWPHATAYKSQIPPISMYHSF